MSLETDLRRAEAWAQNELGAQLRLAEAMRTHEQALGQGDPDEIAASLEQLERELATEKSRLRERRAWTQALAQRFGIDPAGVTLGGVVARAGEQGERLSRLRVDLERAARETAAAGRRIAMIARHQRAVLGEILRTLTGADPESPERASGTLVDAHG
ncbi:MAG: hypothetical protein AAFZ65_11715 [Planctomycetota bacterium]